MWIYSVPSILCWKNSPFPSGLPCHQQNSIYGSILFNFKEIIWKIIIWYYSLFLLIGASSQQWLYSKWWLRSTNLFRLWLCLVHDVVSKAALLVFTMRGKKMEHHTWEDSRGRAENGCVSLLLGSTTRTATGPQPFRGTGVCDGALCPERRGIGLYSYPVYSTEILLVLS